MNSRPAMSILYEEWRTLTVAEAEAIRVGDWQVLETTHDAKLQLQLRIRAEPRLASLRPEHTSSPGLDETIRQGVLAELMQMEQANSQTLAGRLVETQREQATLEGSLQRLRKLRNSYAPGQTSIWQSYS